MTRIAVLSSEPLRPEMAGIGIRYLEMTRALDAAGIEVVLLDPGDGELPAELPVERRGFGAGLAALVADCDGAVAQGQLANDLLLACPRLPTAIDLYDPWLVENFHYLESLGLDPYRNDHATWVLQLTRGDFFLCSSDEQRLFYLGLLCALGRVHPGWPEDDPEYRRLVTPVPFGLADELPPHRPLLDDAEGHRPRILFGGLYDWYDPWTLLDALESLEDRPWTLYFIANPNPGTPQRLLGEVEAWCRRRGWWEERVRLLPWVGAERRFDLLRDVDLMAAPHRPSLETELAMRTRFLEALAAGCPVVTTEGGTVSRLVASADAGWVVPPADSGALAASLAAMLDGGETLAAKRRRGLALAERFRWSEALAPLVEFCREPWRDDSKEAFAFRPATASPPDPLPFRLRRRLRILLGRGAG